MCEDIESTDNYFIYSVILKISIEYKKITKTKQKKNCGHNQMNIQEYHKKINGFKSIHDLAYFLINCLLQIKYKYWGYCFCTDYENRRKCELYVIVNDFSDFED